MSKSIKPRAVAAVAVADLLTGCATVGPDFAAPDASSPAAYAMAGDAAPAGVSMSPEAHAAGPWWTAFGSAALDRTVRQALEGSPSVADRSTSRSPSAAWTRCAGSIWTGR